ncbi:MAG TPA: hypothetical protein VOA80_15135 [Thermoanaerobaculia bacterium]|nr:hypothetical protein [Thermoanaerobaculia bacterium]
MAQLPVGAAEELAVEGVVEIDVELVGKDERATTERLPRTRRLDQAEGRAGPAELLDLAGALI